MATRQEHSPGSADRLEQARGGTDSLVAVNEPPWQYSYTSELLALHGGRSRITSSELNRAAGLDWNVYQTPAYIYVGGDAPNLGENGFVSSQAAANVATGFKLVGTQREKARVPVADYYLNVRDDTHQVVGVVKKRYRILQNSQAPRFLDDFVDSGAARYEAAASLHRGAQVWWLARLRETISVAGDPRENLDTYLLLTNSHDGSTAIVIAVVPIRVASQTTLAWPLPYAPRIAKLKHTDTGKARAIEAQRVLELGLAYTRELSRLAEQMLHTSISNQEFTSFLDALRPTPKPVVKDGRIVNQRGITMADSTKGQITTVYYQNDTQKHLQNTLWGAVEACEFYADHLAICRSTDDASAAENRFKRLTSGQTLGSDAFAKALTLLKPSKRSALRRL